jgi:hypothetical protein
VRSNPTVRACTPSMKAGASSRAGVIVIDVTSIF